MKADSFFVWNDFVDIHVTTGVILHKYPTEKWEYMYFY